MKAWWTAAALVAAGAGMGCTTVKVAQRDGCWVRETHAFPGISREEVGPCARPSPQWSNDRVARLVQECMAEADYRWQTQAVEAWTRGEQLPAQQSEQSVMQACMGHAATAVVSENEVLKRRVAELDAERARLAAVAQEEREHLRSAEDRMTDALGEAAKRPTPNAYATASSSGTANTQTDQNAQTAPLPGTTNINVPVPSAPTPIQVIPAPPREPPVNKPKRSAPHADCAGEKQKPGDTGAACAAASPKPLGGDFASAVNAPAWKGGGTP